MNQRTVKIIRKFCSISNVPIKMAKKVWKSMNWKQRTMERKKMKAVIHMSSKQKFPLPSYEKIS